ncbi:MAG: GIY-YIG nuclease family protein [Bacteroidota bacterium]
MKTYYVYILKCADDSHYTSITSNLSKRLEEHQSGKRIFTRDRRPVQLGFYETFDNLSTAISAELEIKSWPSVRKDALIGEKDSISKLPMRKPPRRKRMKKNQLAFQL